METIQQRDERLWKIAKSRAAFKNSLIVYLVMNLFFWAIWYITTGRYYGGTPWPVWPGLGWGLAIAFQYFNAFHRDPFGDTLREYERLQAEKEQRGL
ncbi:MAG: hypothetical protein H6Q26_2362 [Bacteroidetes bacterium]|uniref:2TM domain-containing protein n=1 Tax=Chitinophaga TaxID=79328 RepID=UPI0009C5BE12|nr:MULTISPECIES: 2TM domain-containing protein [Chitinophaga]MBP1652205.1 hypothetical protein [Bacteroidota bacterium]OMP78366.1 hypothetical protein BW716_15340 [[Flexibacter] sp. ATCC 35208]WPQ64575.1 2TM domain-containing protein [Chitinophaga sancti]WPV69027.1 2TM domain-containing protein [Chitinophaga sp. LS1]